MPRITDILRPSFAQDLILNLANRASLVTLYSGLILSTSIFIYITIYSTYVPIVQHVRPIHLQFDSTCQRNCSNPFAIVSFIEARNSVYLTRGQSYRFIVALEMPESEVNWNQGMFMIRLRLIESQGRVLYDLSRPAILRYKTFLTRIIKSLVYSPFFITNYRNEMQSMQVQIIDNYIEGARFYFNKMDRAMVDVLARDIQIYSAQLMIVANLSGLSYYMYHWPLTSAVLGVSTLASFMAILGIYRGHTSLTENNYIDDYEDESQKQEFDEEQEVDSSSDHIKEKVE